MRQGLTAGEVERILGHMEQNEPREVTLYLVGDNEAEALESILFDSFESAEDWAQDNSGLVWSITAQILPSTLEPLWSN